MPGIIRVQILDIARIEVRRLDVIRRPDTLVDDRVLAHIAHLKLHFGAQVPGGIMVGIGDDIQLAIHDDRLTASDFTRSHDCSLSLL